jgi:dipeptidyl aminopeptidase/acylaminoacyl peptidase
VEARVTAAMVARTHVVAEPRWSASGAFVAWVDAFDGRADLVVARTDRAAPPQIVTADVPVTAVGAYGGGAFAWAGDDQLVCAAGDGRLLVIAVDAGGGGARVISRDGRAAAPAVSPDGTRVAFILERDDACDIAVIPLDGSAWPARVSGDADYAWDPAWAPDGDVLVWHEWDLPNMPWDGSRIAARKVDGLAPAGDAQVVAGGDDVAVGQPRFAPDGSALAFVSDATGWANVWRADADGSRPRPLLEEPAEHAEPSWGPGQRSFAWGPDGGALVLCRNQDGFGRLLLVSSAGKEVRPVAAGWHHGLDWGERGLVCVRSTARTVPAIVPNPTDDRHPPAFAVGAVAGLEAAATAIPKRVEWRAEDGATVPGLLWLPPSPALGPGTLPPLLVDVHGGPTGQATADWSPRHHYFLDRGWAVLAPNYRGSTGYGRAYAQALAGRWGHADVTDTAAGIRHARRVRWCDPNQVAVIGGSAGGLTVLLLAARHPDLVRAAVTLYGVTDLFDLADTTHRFESRYLDRIVGTLPRHAGRYRDRSPVTHAAEITVPVLVLQGADDKVVPPAQARGMVDAMRAAGTPVDYHEYGREGHGFTRVDTISDALERTEAFLARWVLRRS